MTPLRLVFAAGVAFAATVLSACQVSPVAHERMPYTATAVVTGSRIPQPIDPKTGQVLSGTPVYLIQLDSYPYGSAGSIADALRTLPFVN